MAAPAANRNAERARGWKQTRPPWRKNGEVVVADGYGIRVHTDRGQLVIHDGIARDRRVRRYGRATSKLARLVVLGGSGSLTVEALRWLADVGVGLVCIDRDGRILATSDATKSEAKLRRAQALAPHNPSGLQVAKHLLTAKLQGQQRLLDWLPVDDYANRVLRDSLATIQAAETVQQAVLAEAEAAAAYWACWSQVQIRFGPADRGRLPEHWQRFGTRTSTISNSPRAAVNPAGAILNYLYALLETEARLACQVVGLDPALAVIHADTRGRNSLPLDLLEAVRPNVDRYLLALLRDRTFRSADFHETRKGGCRLLAPLTHQLAETLPAWRRVIAPVTEHVCQLLLESEPKAASIPTPLTQANRRADRARRHNRTTTAAQAKARKPEPRCKRCGGPVPSRKRVYCDACLPHFQHDRYEAFRAAAAAKKQAERSAGIDPSHGGIAAQRRGNSRRRRHAEQRAWETANLDVTSDAAVFEREILPLIQHSPLSQLARATGLTHGYVSQVRRGAKVPHPRHWPAFTAGASSSMP